jgi:DNA-binding NtrC family response regulator
VDELSAACAQAVLVSALPEIGLGDLPESITRAAADTMSAPEAASWTPMPLSRAMLEPERKILRAALEANAWNRSETARQLEIDRTTLYKKIRKHRLDEPG